jgi:hypothetical protein
MFKSLIDWLGNKKTLLVFGTFVFLVTIILMPYVQNRILSESNEGDIKNRLVWAVKGECYFVKPINSTENILVRVNDCDKVSK